MSKVAKQNIQHSQIMANRRGGATVIVNMPPTPFPCPPPTQYYPCIGGPSGNQFMFNYLMEDKRIGFFTNDSTPSDTNGPIIYFDQQDY